ncbi:uncharacterized protein PSANT_01466 [Moesziomyces antarcticus]|uniref:Uncharacterized protein n=1 Tax=Pseudozyma antarctica TaxID=84753 RepID=A0A5C3FJS7_PSEA2|nr:uncharacterized protein PSANT_01466 [Moesziomyces antarcticus]
MILGAATPMRKDAARVAISPAPCQPRRSAPIRQCSPRSALSSKLGLSHALPLSPRAISPNASFIRIRNRAAATIAAPLGLLACSLMSASSLCIRLAFDASSRRRPLVAAPPPYQVAAKLHSTMPSTPHLLIALVVAFGIPTGRCSPTQAWPWEGAIKAR